MTLSKLRALKNDPFFDFYINLYTGYSEHEERYPEEIKQIEKDYQEFLKRKMSFRKFADGFKWHYVQQRQLQNISHEDCEKHWKALEILSDAYLNEKHATFADWLTVWQSSKKLALERVEDESATSPETLKELLRESAKVIEMLIAHDTANVDELAENLLKKIARVTIGR